MRQVEFTEPYKIGTETCQIGDRKTMTKADADVLIHVGVAKCVETGEQGERKPGAHALEVQGIDQSV